jgi:hypothetical protein
MPCFQHFVFAFLHVLTGQPEVISDGGRGLRYDRAKWGAEREMTHRNGPSGQNSYYKWRVTS